MGTRNPATKKNAVKNAVAKKSATRKLSTKKISSGKAAVKKSPAKNVVKPAAKSAAEKSPSKRTPRKKAASKVGRSNTTSASKKIVPPGRLMLPPKSGVTVRMYRQGLGDCFLLAFPTGRKGEAYYMLIDCGLIIGGETPRMVSVVNDIREATGGNIHLLVVTHEHWDHVSGFIQGEDIFRDERMRIHNLWFAWTEDPEDKLAEKLRKDFDKEFAAVALALERAGKGNTLKHVEEVMSFFGVRTSGRRDAEEAPSKGRRGTRDAMDVARGLLRKGSPRYCYPSDDPQPLPKVWGIPEPEGIRLYVLGPPHDEGKLRRINPTVAGKEVYEEPALTARAAFTMALHDDDTIGDDHALRDLCYPFDGRLRVSPEDASHHPFFRKYYGFSETTNDMTKPKSNGEAREQGEEWRRIDSDWLGAAGELALQLDSYTNNTSLVLAIELPKSNRVLLFPADAQVGNWLSWDDCSWTIPDEENRGKKIELKIVDLLARTVFYKVGHHGSHNATVRGYKDEKKGLELMNHPDLVAMIPVDQETASKKGWGKMPFPPLIARLTEKTRGRVIRLDQPITEKPATMSSGVWREFKKNYRYDKNGLYLEYEIKDEG